MPYLETGHGFVTLTHRSISKRNEKQRGKLFVTLRWYTVRDKNRHVSLTPLFVYSERRGSLNVRLLPSVHYRGGNGSRGKVPNFFRGLKEKTFDG